MALSGVDLDHTCLRFDATSNRDIGGGVGQRWEYNDANRALPVSCLKQGCY